MTVIDIPDELTVEVTAEDIRLGKPSSNCKCAVALALNRIPGVSSAHVEFGGATVTYTLAGVTYDLAFNLPEQASDFITAFDQEEPVEPFTFTAELSEWS
jgi:hypothetical protein